MTSRPHPISSRSSALRLSAFVADRPSAYGGRESIVAPAFMSPATQRPEVKRLVNEVTQSSSRSVAPVAALSDSLLHHGQSTQFTPSIDSQRLSLIVTRPRAQALSYGDGRPAALGPPVPTPSSPKAAAKKSSDIHDENAPSSPLSSPASGPLSPAGVAAVLASNSVTSPVQAASALALAQLESAVNKLRSDCVSPVPEVDHSISPLIRLDRLSATSAPTAPAANVHRPSSTLESQWRAVCSSGLPVDLLRASSSVHALLSRGVPAAVRPLVWRKLSGSDEERAKHASNYYERLAAIYEEHGCAFDEEIEKDIRRTLPSLNIFKSADSIAAKSLTRILSCYCLRNNTTGYCQGMNMLGGLLLAILPEEDAFWVLTCMIEQRAGYYTRSMCGLEVDLRTLNSLIQYHLPDIAGQMERFEVGVESFSVSWFVCLYCESPLPLNECAVFWDYLFVWGDELLFQLALALLRARRGDIVQTSDAGELLDFLLHSGIRHDLDLHQLLRSLTLGKHANELALLREFHCGEVIRMARQLNPNTAKRLAGQYKFDDAAAVQRLWESFLDPSPWSVLLHSALQSPLRFTQALFVRVFSADQRRKWRDCGLLSGVFDRLFATVDAQQSGYVNFEQFLQLASVLSHGSVDERMRVAFRFYDENGDDRVSQGELSAGFEKFHKLYNGSVAADERDVSRLFAQMMFDRCIHSIEAIDDQQTNAHIDEHEGAGAILLEAIDQRGLTYEHFKYLITLHPFSQAFFGLPEHSGELM